MSNIIWFLIFISFLWPMVHQRAVEFQRIRAIRGWETRRGTRMITLINRQETLSFLGVPLRNYINIEDSEQVLRAIRLTPDDMPIDLVLHTPGGLVLAAEQIAAALKAHPADVTVYVPHYAMSGGTLIALAADRIVMDENAVLGPVDPQLGQWPAASILRLTRTKEAKDIDDETWIMADMAEKAIHQVREFVANLLREHFTDNQARDLAEILSEGTWTHDYPLMYRQLRDFGLPVSTDMPEEIYALMDLYPQPPQRRPTAGYVPLPYHRPRPPAQNR
ncbi:MAG: ATP-dependent Clp protease proteolytic subunit [Kyrpidia tusciae]|nr:ATP-dependent Clp protease proteolytic subunit [Kyrpidia tusciae]MBE3552526.1 ATP-dependent Clp protease proteolytic subunit [Kyrpidia tusciae]